MSGSLLYPLLSTGLILITIFVNFARKIDTDHFQRKVYLSALLFVFAAIVANFAGSMLEGLPGVLIRYLVLAVYTCFFIFQQCSYYLSVAFIDYVLNKNKARTKKIIYLVLGIIALNSFFMIINLYSGFYFRVTDDNQFMYSGYFLARFYMSYGAVLIAIVDIFLSAKHLRSAQLYLITVFALLCGAGAVLDIVLPGGNLVWAFLTAALLAAYFYIIHSDTTLDSITGIGNRSSFTEFMDQVSRMSAKQSYSMILFDIEGLKKINDAHGIKAGDNALADMAALLKQCSRKSDFIARMGDDEFLVAVRAKYDVKRMLSRILRALDVYNEKHERPFSLSVNYGYDSFVSKTDQTAEEFLQALTDLVFQNKQEHRNEMAAALRGNGV